jgi:hypothetical protein
MLDDPYLLKVDNTTAIVTFNKISQQGRQSVSKGASAGTHAVSAHTPQFNCNVAHTSTKAGRERSLLRLDLQTTHSSTAVKESASINLVVDRDPKGSLSPAMVTTLLALLTNTLIEGFGGDVIDGASGAIDPSSVAGQFINGES